MKKGFMLVELVIVVAVIVIIVMSISAQLKQNKQEKEALGLCRIERPLKQFKVGSVPGFLRARDFEVRGEERYYFLYEANPGFPLFSWFEYTSVPVNQTSIVEDGQNKVIFKAKHKAYNDFISFKRDVDQGYFWKIEKFEFHIPKGSVLKDQN